MCASAQSYTCLKPYYGACESGIGPSLFVLKLCAFENWELPSDMSSLESTLVLTLFCLFTAQTPLEDPVRLRSCSAPRGDGASCSAFRCTMATACKDGLLRHWATQLGTDEFLWVCGTEHAEWRRRPLTCTSIASTNRRQWRQTSWELSCVESITRIEKLSKNIRTTTALRWAIRDPSTPSTPN